MYKHTKTPLSTSYKLPSLNMAPGPFSILAPFIGVRKSKKYEKLQTDDPEKKKQEATQEEINRLHTKIVSDYPGSGRLVSSRSKSQVLLVLITKILKITGVTHTTWKHARHIHLLGCGLIGLA